MVHSVIKDTSASSWLFDFVKYKRFSHRSVVNHPRMTLFLFCYVGYVSSRGGPLDEHGAL